MGLHFVHPCLVCKAKVYRCRWTIQADTNHFSRDLGGGEKWKVCEGCFTPVFEDVCSILQRTKPYQKLDFAEVYKTVDEKLLAKAGKGQLRHATPDQVLYGWLLGGSKR
jgi:hypothetical protein